MLRIILMTGCICIENMDHVNKRAVEMARNARREVMNELTPSERQRHKQEEGDFSRKFQDYIKSADSRPYGTPVPDIEGPMQKEVEARVLKRIQTGR